LDKIIINYKEFRILSNSIESFELLKGILEFNCKCVCLNRVIENFSTKNKRVIENFILNIFWFNFINFKSFESNFKFTK
jgi:hypothetical protein